MEDIEWLEYLRARPGASLSLEELREVQRRMGESPEFCEAILGDSRLASLVEAVMALAEPNASPLVAQPAPRSRPWLRGLVIALLGGLALFALVAVIARLGGHRSPEVAQQQVDGTPSPSAELPSPADGAVNADNTSTKFAESPDKKKDAPGQTAVPAPESKPAGQASPPPPTPPAPTPSLAPPPPPPAPWQAVLEDTEQASPFQAICWEGFDPKFSLPTRESLQAWFETVPGHGLRWTDLRLPNGTCGAFEGVMRLKAPLEGDRVLRLALDNFPRLQIHFFAGERGVTLVWSQDDPRWAAYATRRESGSAVPTHWSLIATDSGRARRTEFRAGGPWELRHRDGHVMISRGDVVLMRVPLAEASTDILFQGKATFYGLALSRSADSPTYEPQWPDHSPLPDAADSFAWPEPSKWTSKLVENVRWERAGDGAFSLESPGTKTRGWISTALPSTQIREIIVRLTNARPGVGVFLAQENQPPQQVLRFMVERRTGQTVLAWCGDDDRVELASPPPAEQVAPLTHASPWLRLVVGCGLVRAWQSGNGMDWVELPTIARLTTRGLTHFGLHHVGADRATGVGLGGIWVRELTDLSRTADLALLSNTSAIDAAKDLSAWEQAVRDSRPPNSNELAWWRACAAHSLAKGVDPSWSQAVLDRWLDSLDPQSPRDERFAALRAAAALMDLADSPPIAQQFTARFHRIGWEAFLAEGAPPLSTVRLVLQRASFHQRQNDVAFESRAVRTELLQTLYEARWSETVELVRQLRFFNQQAQTPLLDWVDMMARRATPGRDAPDTAATVPPSRSTGRATVAEREKWLRARGGRGRRDALRGKDSWQHPLNEELAKETYNALAELGSLVNADAYDDAARLITQLDPGQIVGLAPLDEDDELLASLPTAVNWFSAQFPPLREAVRARFDNLAPLRMRPAMQTGESEAVALVASQFAGTAAASEGQMWIGDRALADGVFPLARAAYRRARQGISATQMPALESRLRLVSAMMGEEYGTAPTQPVALGSHTLAVAEFEAIVTELRARTRSGQRSIADRRIDAQAPVAPRPPAKSFEPQPRALLDGPLGERPQEEVTRQLDNLQIDWAGRQIGWALEGDTLWLNNRFQIAAYDLKAGQRLWQTSALEGKKVPRSREWSLVAMQPRIYGDRIYSRIFYGDSPLVGCWNAKDGKQVWLADQLPGVMIASDPWLVQDRVIALTVTRLDGTEVLLRLATFDALNGDLLAHVELAQLRSSWFARHCCETTLIDDTLVATVGGAVLACDTRGNVRWIRRQIALPTDEEPEWVTQAIEPPLASGDRVYVAQPGVRAIDCLEIDTGRRLWRRFLPDVRRAAAIVEGRLIVTTDRGIEALDLSTGTTVWRHEATKLLTGFVAGGPHGVVYCRAVPSSDAKKQQPELVWIDARDGLTRTTIALETLADAAPRFGPIVPHGDRLFALFGRGQAEARRELLELIYK
jgi:outer membrane protein assembly factor BamB